MFLRRPALAAVLLLSGPVAVAILPIVRGTAVSAPAQTTDLTSAAPRTWAEDAARNELEVVNFSSGFVRYHLRTVNSKGDQTRDLIETPEGPVARLFLRDGHPLTQEQDTAEQTRLQSMLEDPEAFRKHTREDQNGKHTAADLIHLLPDAMLYSYAVGQPQRSLAAAPEVVLDFKPNPNWSPPTTISGALTGLQGRLWIDARTRRMTRLECTIFRPINIGFGVLAHVNAGGTITVDQVELPNGRPIVSHFSEHVELRALVVKSLHENDETSATNFESVEAMSYSQAIHRLLATPLPH